MLIDRGLVWDSGLHARHRAAMNVIKRGCGEDERALLLSYVVWPTEWIEAVLDQALAVGAKGDFLADIDGHRPVLRIANRLGGELGRYDNGHLDKSGG